MKISRVPAGLSKLLQIWGGVSPTELEDRARLVVDLRDNYGASLLVGSTGAPTIGALTNLQEQLALTTTLRVRSISALLIVGAAPVTAGGFIEWGFFAQNGQVCPQGQFSYGVALATQIIGCGTPMDIVLPGGTTFYSRAGGTAGGADHSLSVIACIENWTGSA